MGKKKLTESDLDIISSFIDDHTTSDEAFFREFTLAIFDNLGWKYYPMDKDKYKNLIKEKNDSN
jgi:hypothetical protein